MKLTCLLTALILALPIPLARAANIYWDTDGPYTIDDDTYESDHVYLDYNIANDPGTHLDLLDNGRVGQLSAYNNATVTMSGGWSDFIAMWGSSTLEVTGGLAPLSANDHSTINIFGGNVGATARDNSVINIYDGASVVSPGARDNSHLNIYGGDIDGVGASYDATIDIYGGTIYDGIGAGENSQVNVYGYDLILSPTGGFAGHGTLVGYLQDGSAIDVYLSSSETYSHINLIPEPSLLAIFTLGALYLPRRRR